MAKKGKFSHPRTPDYSEPVSSESLFPDFDPPSEQESPLPEFEEDFSISEEIPASGAVSAAKPVVYNREEQDLPYLEKMKMEADFPDDPEEDDPPFLDKLYSFFTENRKIVVVGLFALALVLIVGIICAFFFGSASDPYDGKILNNVTVAGINVGGMTRREAENALRSATDLTYAYTDMVVQLPDEVLRFSPEDTQVKLDVSAAVKAAYDYGRTGTPAEREDAYNASLTGNHTIGLLPYLDLNEDFIRSALEDYVSKFGSVFTEASYQLEGDMPTLAVDSFDENAPCQTLVITMGTPGITLDTEAIYTDILDAYSLNRFTVKVEEVQAQAVPEDPDLQAIYDAVCMEPVDSSIDMQTYKIIPGAYGYVFSLEDAQRQVDRADFGQEIRLPMEYVEPEILSEEVFFQDVLGSCETRHTNNQNRNTNLRLACEALNGLVLQPGEEFSFNNALGQRTAEKGYKPAPAYSGIETIDSIGGGICQVSSTLYYCTLLADLEIVFRTNHGFVSSYIDYGMDATVSWGYPDFKFRNSTNYPIKITAEVSDGYVRMQILGTDEKDYYIKMSYLVTNEYPYDVIYEEYPPDNPEGYTDGQVLQNGTTGYLVKTYKNKYDKETNELISRDYETSSTYKTVDKIVVRIVDNTPEETTPPTETTPPPSVGETTPVETTPTESAPAQNPGGETTPTEASGADADPTVPNGNSETVPAAVGNSDDPPDGTSE